MKQDFVTKWFHSSGVSMPKLKHRAIFHLPYANLVVRTNEKSLSRNFETGLQHYLGPRIRSGSSRGEPVFLEIYAVTGKQAPHGIQLTNDLISKRTRIATPEPVAGDEVNRFHYFREDGWEGLWRPFDLLAAFSPRDARLIKVLVFQGAAKDKLLPARKDVIAKKGVEGDVLLNLVLILHLRLFGLVCLHAASLSSEERGVLLVGPSGSGKTTTAAALVRDGFDLLSDEMTGISTAPDNAAWIEGILLRPRLFARRRPDLARLEDSLGIVFPAEKRVLPLDPDLVRKGMNRKARAQAVIFLTLPDRPSRKHRLLPIDVEKSFGLLLSQVLDPAHADRHEVILRVLCSLLDQCARYRLILGTDLGSLPGLIRKVLENGHAPD